MRKRQREILIVAIVIVMVWTPITTLAQETHLRWKNGDALSGKLLESKSGKIRWASPYFSDDLIIDTNVLDSIVFSKQPAPATETFRVGTVSGDIWIADIVGSDENSLHFFSKRHGKFRVNRELIYSLESRSHPNLIFDGSQLNSWKSPKENVGRKAVENQHTGWHPDHNGHPHTDQKKANIFHTIEWPKRFEIDLELASTIPNPGFVLALGKNLYETLRVETWIHELVVVQGTLFESIMAIGPDRRSFRLRLAYDQDLGLLKVFDLNGNLLLELENVQPTLTSPGLYIYNRGQNLTIRRLKVYRQPAEFKNQQADFSKPRVHMMNGEVFYGKLFVEKDKAYVLDTDGGRSDINLLQIDRVVLPGKTLTKTGESMALTYIDGSVIRGQIVQLNIDSVLLQTTFADQPITCSFAGASMLRFESKAKIKERGQDYDKMFFPSNSLRGHVIFDSKDTSSIQLQPVGTSEPVPLANTQSVRVERNNKHVSRLRPFDVEMFPHLLHLKNGEVIPCKVVTYDQTAVSLRSPFISATRIDSAHIKGIEFTRGKTQTRKENRNPITITGGDKHRIILEDGRKLDATIQRAEDGTLKIIVNNGKLGENPKVVILRGDVVVNEVAALQHGVEVMFDPLETQSEALDVKLERALTVPRFNRDNPPNHILVANNGDLRRGKFLRFNGDIILFESNLKKITIPIDRVARIVDISVEDSDTSVKEAVDNQQPTVSQSQVRFALIHNPILIFEPLEVKGDKLYGRSPIYGEVSVPVKSIQYLHFGEKAKSFKSVFEEWVVRSAKEPDYGADR